MKTKWLSQASQDLRNDISWGLFTPFFGAGASSLRPEEVNFSSYPWNQVAETLTAISSHLSAHSREFLRSFAKKRLAFPSSEEISRIIPRPASECEDDDRSLAILTKGIVESDLVKLQAALVRATLRLTRYFGVRFCDESPSVHHLDDCSVEFDYDPNEILDISSSEFLDRLPNTANEVKALARDCVERLREAEKYAYHIRVSTDGRQDSLFLVRVPGVRRRLERERIHEKLENLIGELVGEESDVPYRMFEEKRKQGRKPKLRLDAIQWLTDLLWYTVRYWVPCYPTTAELAFELSLAVKDAPPRRAELAQAAQALDNEDTKTAETDYLGRYVRDLIKYCETAHERHGGPDEQTKSFYYSIAAAMQYQFEKYTRVPPPPRLMDRFQSGTPGQSASSQGAGPAAQNKIPPIVFTTNFDTALEQVFQEKGICYHVVFPVTKAARSVKDEKSRGLLTWKIMTYSSTWRTHAPSPENWNDVYPDDATTASDLVGPIIVKLHGSPSLMLNDPTDQHCLVLSEAGYLEAVGNASLMPPWLESQLTLIHRYPKQNDAPQEGNGGPKEVRQEEKKKEISPLAPRSLWFFGYSISDWNVRLRLYEHCRTHMQHGGSRNTVDRTFDMYRAAIFHKLNIDHCVGELNRLPKMICEALREEERQSDEELSDKVKQLMREIKR